MKRFLGLSLVVAAVVVMVADTAEARFGRRRARNCCATQCQSGCAQNGCAPQAMAYHGQDPNMAGAPGSAPPPAPQPNTTFYRGNPDQPLNNQGQPRTAPQVQGRTNLQGSAGQNGIRANAEAEAGIDQND